MKIQMLVLANSKKPGGRCLAGIRTDTLDWIRPVTTSSHNEMPTQSCINSITAEPLRPLDLIEIEITEPLPLKYQRENWLSSPSSITYSRKVSIESALPKLETKIDKMPWFLKDGTTKIDPADYRKYKTDAPSLALIEVASAELVHNQRGSRRIHFKHGSKNWDLPFTDDYFQGEDGTLERSLLCLSIGEEWQGSYGTSDQGWHYKLVAGLVKLPADTALTPAAGFADSLIAICERLFNFTPKVSDDRNQLGRFSTSGWFYQDLAPINCALCGNPGLMVFRKHFKKYAKEMHYWGIVCGSCKTGSDSKVFPKKFIRQLDESLESIRPVSSCCHDCISNVKNF
jgi:hypothetical protein